MSTSHDTNERRQAIWPWLLMPIVVLLVAYTLHDFQKHSAKSADAQAQLHSSATAAGDSTDP
jgi:hypothetical protein